MNEFSLAVIGIDYPNADKSNRRFELLQCVPGEPVQLVLEPKNKHDPLAIAVFSARGHQVGYLTAERAPLIGAKLRAGEEARVIFQQLDQHAAWIRIRFGGGDPTLPPPHLIESGRAEEEDVGFYPDPDGPEWGA